MGVECTDVELLQAWQSGDREAGNQFVRRHESLVYSIIHRCKKGRVIKQTEMDELFQSGCVALFHAMQSYDPTKGAKFATYAYMKIFKAVNRAIFHLWNPLNVSEKKKKRMFQLLDVWNEYTELPSRTLSFKMYAMDALKISRTVFRNTLDDVEAYLGVSLLSDERKHAASILHPGSAGMAMNPADLLVWKETQEEQSVSE